MDFDDEEIFADTTDDNSFAFPEDEKIDIIDTETTIEPRKPTTTTILSSSTTVRPSVTSSSTTTLSSPSPTTASEEENNVRTRIGPGYSSEEENGDYDEAVSILGPRSLSLCLPLTRTECGLVGDKTVWRNLLEFIEVF